MAGDAPQQDPILARRDRVRALVRHGQRLGSALYLLAAVAFVAGFSVGFGGWVVVVVTIGLVAGSAFLAPAIVLGHAVRAADRADRERSW